MNNSNVRGYKQVFHVEQACIASSPVCVLLEVTIYHTTRIWVQDNTI